MITFLCPNGHKLSTPDQHAGRVGQCPECGVKFRVPLPEPAADDEAADPGETQPPESGEPPAQPDSGLIVFLCPNGHRLHGPPQLAGRAGQCPHCGVRFRIPPLTESVEDERLHEPELQGSSSVGDSPTSAVEEESGEEIPLEEIEELEAAFEEGAEEGAPTSIEITHVERAVAEPAGSEFDFLTQAERPGTGTYGLHVVGTEGLERPVARAHPLAELLEHYWDRRGAGTKIEIRLTSGETLLPHHYAADLSQRSHGCFAVRDQQGTYTLVAVPWENVVRISIAGIDVLPAEFS